MEPFVIFTLWIWAIGPGYIEGGLDAIESKGIKPAIIKAYDERRPYDETSLKGKLGNFGND